MMRMPAALWLGPGVVCTAPARAGAGADPESTARAALGQAPWTVRATRYPWEPVRALHAVSRV